MCLKTSNLIVEQVRMQLYTNVKAATCLLEVNLMTLISGVWGKTSSYQALITITAIQRHTVPEFSATPLEAKP